MVKRNPILKLRRLTDNVFNGSPLAYQLVVEELSDPKIYINQVECILVGYGKVVQEQQKKPDAPTEIEEFLTGKFNELRDRIRQIFNNKSFYRFTASLSLKSVQTLDEIGESLYNFTFHLDQSLPPSFKGTHSNISYRVILFYNYNLNGSNYVSSLENIVRINSSLNIPAPRSRRVDVTDPFLCDEDDSEDETELKRDLSKPEECAHIVPSDIGIEGSYISRDTNMDKPQLYKVNNVIFQLSEMLQRKATKRTTISNEFGKVLTVVIDSTLLTPGSLLNGYLDLSCSEVACFSLTMSIYESEAIYALRKTKITPGISGINADQLEDITKELGVPESKQQRLVLSKTFSLELNSAYVPFEMPIPSKAFANLGINFHDEFLVSHSMELSLKLETSKCLKDQVSFKTEPLSHVGAVIQTRSFHNTVDRKEAKAMELSYSIPLKIMPPLIAQDRDTYFRI